jgi:alkylation response protein AidB-like acyl-CoA dehydrogenase
MHFELSDDQIAIRASAREFLTGRMEEDGDVLWREAIELGWPALAISEEHGGLGLGTLEAAVLAIEHGYACVSTPLIGVLAAARLIEVAGSAEQQDAWLPRLATGAADGAAGVSKLVGDVGDGDGDGCVVLVENGGLILIDHASAYITPVVTIDTHRRYARVEGTGTNLPGNADLAIANVRVVAAAELVGLALRALDESVAYAKDRVQFGRPVGAFQAVSHRCADVLVAAEGARSAVYYAGWACAKRPHDAPRAAALAKAAASDAAREATAAAIQVHGGVGFSWEAPLHRLYKRAQLGAALWGTAPECRLSLVATAV